ncbi:hypothetical protein AQUCO_00400191v1 [Aquilegia coerulea]|uniref:FAF domain-containing protein n=1 Tax=Aquilegia coerulea TaxID=218851 RepID=A0A2G5ETS0_AQUCA|nr:hypothetical protein AQUCO_00400191v1 [Aquilegia coerulea]
MTSCGNLGQIFENPLPENPSLIESLSTWNHSKSNKQPKEVSSFTEIFGELHFKESLESSSLPFLPPLHPSPSSSLLDLYSKPEIKKSIHHDDNKNSSFQSLFGAKKTQEVSCSKKDGFSSMNSESLQMCTEGLGFESFGDVDSDNEKVGYLNKQKEKVGTPKDSFENAYREHRRLRSFPPPIPSIGRNGKPWVSYKSFRCDGRLVLKEIMTPTQGQEFMHACREHGRLTLHLVHRDEEIEQDVEKANTDEEEIEDGDKAKGAKHFEKDEINDVF